MWKKKEYNDQQHQLSYQQRLRKVSHDPSQKTQEKMNQEQAMEEHPDQKNDFFLKQETEDHLQKGTPFNEK